MEHFTNYFVEGLQGAGKSTLAGALSGRLPEYKVFREGDYSPVELAWCAYVTEAQYEKILARYSGLAREIADQTVFEDDRRIICYTQIITDADGFHKNLEQYEIYNGNTARDEFETTILSRYQKWNGTKQIFECSVFQNVIENQMLYLMMTDEEILDFYRKLGQVLSSKPYKIIYLDVENIFETIEVIKKERSDDEGNELWFPLMLRYLEEAPYGKLHSLRGMEGLLKHLERRKKLEHRIINEVFKDRALVVKAKEYELEQIIAAAERN